MNSFGGDRPAFHFIQFVEGERFLAEMRSPTSLKVTGYFVVVERQSGMRLKEFVAADARADNGKKYVTTRVANGPRPDRSIPVFLKTEDRTSNP